MAGDQPELHRAPSPGGTEAIELLFPTSAYSADAIQRAAYRMSDRLSIDLVVEPEQYRCSCHLLPNTDAGAVLYEFRNGVLDETLRERIRHETEGVRNVILALAFANTSLSESD